MEAPDAPENYIKDQHTVKEYLDKINNDNIANFQTHKDKVVEIKLGNENKKYKLGRIIKLWEIINDTTLQGLEEEYDFFIKKNNEFFIEYDAKEGIIPPNFQNYSIYLYKIYEVIINDNNVVSYKPTKMNKISNPLAHNNIKDKITKNLPAIDGSEVDINDEFLQAYRINNIHPANRDGYNVNDLNNKYVYGIWKKDGGILKYLSVTHMENTGKFKVEWKDAKLH